MTLSRFASTSRRALTAILALAAFACSDNDPAAPPTLDTITVAVPVTSLMTGQTSTATAAGVDQHGDSIAVGTVTWSSSATGIATAKLP